MRSCLRMVAEQIGVQALAIPEEMGGAGYGFDELAIVMGRRLAGACFPCWYC